MFRKLRSLYGKFRDRSESDGLTQASKSAAKYLTNQLTKHIIRPLYEPPSIYINSRLSDRWNIFNEEWDLLIILDGCRVDAMRKVADEYAFIEEVESRWSVGAQSGEWMLNTFNQSYKDEISKTAYVSSNANTWIVWKDQHPRAGKRRKDYHRRLKRYNVNSPVDPNSFFEFTELFELSEDYGKQKYPSQRSVTDHVIRLDRGDCPPPRMVAHYMPPHPPFLAQSENREVEFVDEPRERTFEAYLDNLRWGLEEVEMLLENVDREKVVITSDHGWAFRLQPIRNSHKPGMVAPDVRRVPWVKTSATTRSRTNPSHRMRTHTTPCHQGKRSRLSVT